MPPKFVREYKLYHAERITGAVGILMGMFMWFYTKYKGWGSNAKSVVNNPGFFPRIVAVGLVLLGIVLIVKTMYGDKEKTIVINLLSLVLIGGWMIYVFLINILGFVASSIFVMFFTCILWGISNKKTIVLVSILTPVIIYLVMVQVLHVKFPTLF